MPADCLKSFARVAKERPHVAVLRTDHHRRVRLANTRYSAGVTADALATRLGVVAQDRKHVMHADIAASGCGHLRGARVAVKRARILSWSRREVLQVRRQIMVGPHQKTVLWLEHLDLSVRNFERIGRAIVGEADRRQTQIFVMGPPRRRRARAGIFGGTTDFVLKHAPCRVMVVAAREAA